MRPRSNSDNNNNNNNDDDTSKNGGLPVVVSDPGKGLFPKGKEEERGALLVPLASSEAAKDSALKPIVTKFLIDYNANLNKDDFDLKSADKHFELFRLLLAPSVSILDISSRSLGVITSAYDELCHEFIGKERSFIKSSVHLEALKALHSVVLSKFKSQRELVYEDNKPIIDDAQLVPSDLKNAAKNLMSESPTVKQCQQRLEQDILRLLKGQEEGREMWLQETVQFHLKNKLFLGTVKSQQANEEVGSEILTSSYWTGGRMKYAGQYYQCYMNPKYTLSRVTSVNSFTDELSLRYLKTDEKNEAYYEMQAVTSDTLHKTDFYGLTQKNYVEKLLSQVDVKPKGKELLVDEIMRYLSALQISAKSDSLSTQETITIRAFKASGFEFERLYTEDALQEFCQEKSVFELYLNQFKSNTEMPVGKGTLFLFALATEQGLKVYTDALKELETGAVLNTKEIQIEELLLNNFSGDGKFIEVVQHADGQYSVLSLLKNDLEDVEQRLYEEIKKEIEGKIKLYFEKNLKGRGVTVEVFLRFFEAPLREDINFLTAKLEETEDQLEVLKNQLVRLVEEQEIIHQKEHFFENRLKEWSGLSKESKELVEQELLAPLMQQLDHLSEEEALKVVLTFPQSVDQVIDKKTGDTITYLLVKKIHQTKNSESWFSKFLHEFQPNLFVFNKVHSHVFSFLLATAFPTDGFFLPKEISPEAQLYLEALDYLASLELGFSDEINGLNELLRLKDIFVRPVFDLVKREVKAHQLRMETSSGLVSSASKHALRLESYINSLQTYLTGAQENFKYLHSLLESAQKDKTIILRGLVGGQFQWTVKQLLDKNRDAIMGSAFASDFNALQIKKSSSNLSRRMQTIRFENQQLTQELAESKRAVKVLQQQSEERVGVLSDKIQNLEADKANQAKINEEQAIKLSEAEEKLSEQAEEISALKEKDKQREAQLNDVMKMMKELKSERHEKPRSNSISSEDTDRDSAMKSSEENESKDNNSSRRGSGLF